MSHFILACSKGGTRCANKTQIYAAPAVKGLRVDNSPISCALLATGLLHWVTNLYASSRISMTLLIRAQSGARGKAATKIVTNPY